MPITKSAKKALRKDATRRKRNEQVKQNVKRILRQARDFVAQKKIGEAKGLLPQLFRVLDKAAKTGVIKKNAAARKKSRIAKLLQNTSQAPAAN
ncbi:MAG: 30S ribosomal protein S20 [Nanoarchaeota archaeon]